MRHCIVHIYIGINSFRKQKPKRVTERWVINTLLLCAVPRFEQYTFSDEPSYYDVARYFDFRKMKKKGCLPA